MTEDASKIQLSKRKTRTSTFLSAGANRMSDHLPNTVNDTAEYVKITEYYVSELLKKLILLQIHHLL